MDRRQFLSDAGLGFGSLALAAMVHRDGVARSPAWAPPDGRPHLAPKAKSVIWIFLIGGISAQESFDPKPALTKYGGMSIDDTPHSDVLQSPYLDKTIANRMWQHFLGYGFTKPIDDFGTHNAPSHPALLDYLGEEVRKNSFNLKELIRWIALSEAYSLSSKVTRGNAADDPLLGETPKFTHFYLRQMRAEELYESLLVATQAHKSRGGSYEEQEKLKAEWLKQFTLAFGTDEGDESTTFNGTIPQSLMMMNGDLVKDATSIDRGSFLQTIAASNLKAPEKIDYLFQAALARGPSREEIGIANKLLAARQGDGPAALQDIFWAVLNSNEFILQH